MKMKGIGYSMIPAYNRVYNRKKAFSLVEVLLTMALLAGVILYFILALTIGRYATQLSKERLIINGFLRESVENILETNYTLIDGMAGTSSVSINDGSRIISADITLDPPVVVDPGLYGYKKIRVRIDWTGGVTKNRALQQEVVMYVTKI